MAHILCLELYHAGYDDGDDDFGVYSGGKDY